MTIAIKSAPSDRTAALELRLFGHLDIRVHGQPLPSLRNRKEKWILALLALRHDREVARDWLATTFWPENEEGQARFYLRKALSNLRNALGPEAARLQSPTSLTVKLDLTDAFSDARLFDASVNTASLQGKQEQRLQEAIALYRGPLLQDCLEEWVIPERAARQQSYLSALEVLADQARERGETTTASRCLQLILATEPYRESAAASLMQTLADSGDRAALRQVYQDLRLRLREHLNTSPSPETETLYKRLSQQKAQPAPLPPAPAMASQRHLPVPLTDLIGREREIAEIKTGLGRSRMLTLLGPGGVGKTRLSIAAADAALSQFSDGVWFVDLAPLTEGAYIAESVAQTLGVSQETGHSAETRLVAELSSRSLLLVFDNCEHLLDASAALASRLLSACPDLRILTTSRQALGVTGEQVYPVASLDLPFLSGKEGSTDLLAIEKNPAFLLEYAGIQLFVQRAVQANPAFRLDRRNALAVVEICQQLDGIPLAIELAAARLRSLSVADIQVRLTDRFRLLNNGSRSALPRQQTLRAALDWSYKLLSAEEQALLNRLCLFAGGWTLEAAEKVGVDEGADAWEVLDTLTALVEKSLVVYEQRGEARYHLLETIRQYARDRLLETGEMATYHSRYCDYFVALAEEAGPKLSGPDQALWQDRLETEHDNLRQVLASGGEMGEGIQKGLRLLGSLSHYWVSRNYLKEAQHHCAVLLAREEPPAPTRVRAKVLLLAGNLAYCLGDNKKARQYYEDTLAIHRHLGNRRGVIGALGSLGNIAHTQGDYERARSILEEVLLLCREDGGVHAWEAVALTILGNVTCDQKDYDASRTYTGASLKLCREIGDRKTESLALSGLGRIALHQGVPADALRFYEQALIINREIGNVSQEAECLGNLGITQVALGDIAAAATLYCQSLSLRQEANDQRPIPPILEAIAGFLTDHSPRSLAAACRILGAAEKLREDTGSARLSSEQDIYDRIVPRLHQSLSAPTFSEAWSEGRAMTTANAIAYAIEETETARTGIATL